jgi:hypothetical protein
MIWQRLPCSSVMYADKAAYFAYTESNEPRISNDYSLESFQFLNCKWLGTSLRNRLRPSCSQLGTRSFTLNEKR